MLFSVVIPTYNRIKLLACTLNSVWSQSFSDFEVIVVDDGSADGTLEFLASLKGQADVLMQPHRGPGAARNLGASHARGKYLAFLDSDDLWFPWTLEVYREIACRPNSPSIIAGKPHRFWTESELAGLCKG